jgi:RND family efflux transporter MFP subunit
MGMNKVQQRYLSHMTTLDKIQVPRVALLMTWLLLVTIVVGLLVLWFTPWVQTAHGNGVVDATRPEQRIQAISALVPGQVKTWHVREGDRVLAGDPIVTLRDTDIALISRVNAQIAAMDQQVAASTAALETAEQDLVRQTKLFSQGLVSKRDVEQVEIRLGDLRAKVAVAVADMNQARVGLARQAIQTKMAPMDGIIMRLLSAGNATFVKAGDILASFIPDGVERSVVISVSGLDAPLVYPGRKVRLQFDGWPVFQITGWPSSAVGTFGGVVEFVEPIADTKGQFRVWVKEDSQDSAWPSAQYVRLGSRVRGWVLLDEVKLGYELWRQLNNFPPVNSGMVDEANAP